jgi:hypothetical protein
MTSQNSSSVSCKAVRLELIGSIIDLDDSLLHEAASFVKSLREKRRLEQEQWRKEEEKKLKARSLDRMLPALGEEEKFIDKRQFEINALGLPFNVDVEDDGISLRTFERNPPWNDPLTREMMEWFKKKHTNVIYGKDNGWFTLVFDIHAPDFVYSARLLLQSFIDTEKRLLGVLTGEHDHKRKKN